MGALQMSATNASSEWILPSGLSRIAFGAKKVPPHPIWNIRERQRANSNGRSQESPAETPAGTIEQTVLKLHNTINVEVVGDR
jgi:hypothetical protein